MTIDVPLDSPQGNILNYSIVSSDEEENPLRLKLKISNKNKTPIVVLKRIDHADEYAAPPRSSNRPRKIRSFDGFEMDLSVANLKTVENESSTPRKRGKSKKIDLDAEMSSPTKMQRPQRTPRKRTDVDTNLEKLCMSMKDKVRLTTPVKRSLTKADYANLDYEDESPRKKGMIDRTPVKDTPRRRGSRRVDSPMKVDEENEGIISGKRRASCTPVRLVDEYKSPRKSVKVNLDESFRRSVLKSRHNVENIRGDPSVTNARDKSADVKSRDSSVGTRRSARKSYKPVQHFFDSDEDPLQVPEAPKKNEIEVSANRRILRSRSNSTVSNASAASDSDYLADKSSLTPRITRSRKNSTMSTDSDCLYMSPEKKAPRRTAPKTPKTPRTSSKRTAATPKTVPITPKTPKNRLKMLRDGVITPSMHSRTSMLPGDSTPLMKARSQLHVSYVPTSLPCREKEYLDVYNFLRGKLDDNCGGCMYISGVPGTGKTATVTSVIDSLLKDKAVSKFCYVSINGMRLTEPRQSYVEIWKQLTEKTVPWEQAQSLLEERFTKKKKQNPVVMLIDELDILCTKRQDVVYNLLDWPTKSKDQLIVITIANTMDLPERLLMSRVTSRLGLTRLTFQAYTHKQLMEIVTKRLMGTDSFNSDAVQLVARKVASVSGDARRALDICRRAAEIAEEEGKGQMVNIMHINEALTAMITQPHVMAMRRCSRLQRLLLQAIVAEIERTGVEETTFSDTFRMLVSCCALDGFKMVSSTVAQRALCQLSACKLILTDQKCSDIYQKVVLNVSIHDVYFALKKV